jgi:hypothetical protein
MFENLTDRLGRALKNLRGQGRLTEDNIKDALREVRMALLEADVALPVVREFIDHVRARAVGQEVSGSLTPGQALIKIVRDELVAIMGAESAGLDLNVTPPAVILMAGLQGSGKTTTVAQAGAPPERAAEEIGAGGQRRRLPAGRDPAARGRWPARSARSSFPAPPTKGRKRSPPRQSSTRAASSSTSSSSTPPAACISTRR